MRWTRLFSLALITPIVGSTLGCDDEEVKYEPRPAPSSVQANLPAKPTLPGKPVKAGDAYTVWGASYTLRSRVHRDDIDGKDVKITGYITKTNLADAPKCAVHETGKADPEGCKAPIPTFWLADSADASEKDSIRVMGWASNFAQLYDAIKEFKKNEKKDKADVEPFVDGFWAVNIPNPLPVKGAKVTVKGNYSNAFTRASRGSVADPIMGVLTYAELEYHETPDEVATLPGMR